MNINFYVIANLYKNDIINRVGCQGLIFKYFSTEIWSLNRVYPKSTLLGGRINGIFLWRGSKI